MAKTTLDFLQNLKILSDRLTDDQWFCVLQCLSDVLPTGNFSNASVSSGIL